MDLDSLDTLDGAPDLDTWCTPRDICEAIGEVDLDPCNNERAHVLAKKTFRLSRKQDGLVLAKFVKPSTRVFLNCPYSRGQVERWVDAYSHTRFIALLRFDTSTAWFEKLMKRTELIMSLRNRRMDFEPPPGVEASSNPFPHTFFVSRAEDASEAIRAMCYVWKTCR